MQCLNVLRCLNACAPLLQGPQSWWRWTNELPKTCINSNLMHFLVNWVLENYNTVCKRASHHSDPSSYSKMCTFRLSGSSIFWYMMAPSWLHDELHNVLSLLRNVNTHPVEDHGCDEESPSIPGWKSNWGIGSREGWVESYLVDMAISRWIIGTSSKDCLIVICEQRLIWLDWWVQETKVSIQFMITLLRFHSHSGIHLWREQCMRASLCHAQELLEIWVSKQCAATW